jgi:hypothetical protein
MHLMIKNDLYICFQTSLKSKMYFYNKRLLLFNIFYPKQRVQTKTLMFVEFDENIPYFQQMTQIHFEIINLRSQ